VFRRDVRAPAGVGCGSAGPYGDGFFVTIHSESSTLHGRTPSIAHRVARRPGVSDTYPPIYLASTEAMKPAAVVIASEATVFDLLLVVTLQ